MAEKRTDDILRELVDDYRARASEYDGWFLRQGRYDRGAELNARWFAAVDEVSRALESSSSLAGELSGESRDES